jgi:hypothetical protein
MNRRGPRARTTAEQTTPKMLPIIVPATKGDAYDGHANFYRVENVTGSGFRSGGRVRRLRGQDILEQSIRAVLSAEEYTLLTGTLDLKRARETHDRLLNRRAQEKLRPFLDDFPQGSFKYLGWANVDVPRLVTDAMQQARLVLWYEQKPAMSGKFVPAIYCPNLRTAIFVRAFMNLRTCPYCGAVFAPRGLRDVYCKPAHGNAYRMARSRYNKAMRAEARRKR